MNIYGLQFDIVWEDKLASHARVTSLLQQSEIPPGSLIVLPEMFSTGFSMNVAQIAEGEERVTERFLTRLAREYRSLVLGGVVSSAPDGRGRNEAVLISPEGSIRTRYQKIHPFRYGGETDFYEAGEKLVLFDWHGITVAPLICYDLRFPEIFRRAVRQGAQLFAVIANWPQAREDHWTTLLKARAIENQAYIIGVNRCGADPKVTYSGRSLIIDPRGQVLADAGNSETILSATVDLRALLAYRDQFPALKDMKEGWGNG